MIHILNNQPEQYDHIVDILEIRLMRKDDDPDELVLDDIQNETTGLHASLMKKNIKMNKTTDKMETSRDS